MRGAGKPLTAHYPDREIADYPGYLGLYFDGSQLLETILEPLGEFPWSDYRDFEPDFEQPDKTTIEFFVGSELVKTTFDRGDIDLVSFLEIFPTVVVRTDEEVLSPEEIRELGPASGGDVAPNFYPA